jgi:hypothetical protein
VRTGPPHPRNSTGLPGVPWERPTADSGTRLHRFDESGPGPIVLTSELVWVGGDEDELVGFTPDSGTVNKQYQADSAIVSLAADRDTLSGHLHGWARRPGHRQLITGHFGRVFRDAAAQCPR